MAVGMRTAEVYLILAEAMARLNDLSGSVEVLNQLREKRIKGSEAVLPEPATQREMMQEIINERRKELLFGFSRFWDLKRFNTEADYAEDDYPYFSAGNYDRRTENIYIETGFTFVHLSIPQ